MTIESQPRGAEPAPHFVRAHPVITALLALIAVLALALPAVIVATAPTPVKVARKLAQQRVVSAAELPPVEPLAYVDVTPDDARAFNASVPFSTAPNPAARPFHLGGSDADQARAVDCLAAAVLYEAGDDTTGEQAVAQVIINRVRHPAFPKSVCGVVFQGSERRTGCQFTFTCDGAMARWRPSDAAWDRARDVARSALNGKVDKAVGYATHYHTDWVVPYWSASLDKIARVGTHLFFRWTGWWGTPPAFRRQVSDTEPVIALLAAISPAHNVAGLLLDGVGPLDATAIANGGLPAPLASDPDTFLVTLDPKWPPASFAVLAAQACGDRPYCKFMAWSPKVKAPPGVPLNAQQIAAMSFSYLRDRAHNYDKALWNCAEFKRDTPVQCMKKQVFLPATVQAAAKPSTPSAVIAPPVVPTVKPAPDGLDGVHRKATAATPALPSLPPASLTPDPR